MDVCGWRFGFLPEREIDEGCWSVVLKLVYWLLKVNACLDGFRFRGFVVYMVLFIYVEVWEFDKKAHNIKGGRILSLGFLHVAWKVTLMTTISYYYIIILIYNALYLLKLMEGIKEHHLPKMKRENIFIRIVLDKL